MGATVSITRLDLTTSDVRKATSRENDCVAASGPSVSRRKEAIA